MVYQGLLLTCLIGGIITTQKLDKKLQKLKFSAPVLTEEEEKSVHLPDAFRCDACKAIAFQLKEAFDRAESKFTSRKVLKESEIIEITDDTCENGFEMYGLKAIDGMKHLSGPGLEANNVAGMVQMGGKWPKRVRALCSFYIGEIGDEKIYDVHRKAQQNLVSFLCMGDGVRGSCKQHNSNSNSADNQRANYDDL